MKNVLIKKFEFKPGVFWPIEMIESYTVVPNSFEEISYQGYFNLKDQNQTEYNLYRYNLEFPNIIKNQIGQAVERAVQFGNKVENEFKIFNVQNGITQMGLTGPVLCMMTKKIKIMSSTAVPFEYEISLADALWSGSLTEAPKLIDKIIANENLIALSPFLSPTKLTEMKNYIIKYLLGQI